MGKAEQSVQVDTAQTHEVALSSRCCLTCVLLVLPAGLQPTPLGALLNVQPTEHSFVGAPSVPSTWGPELGHVSMSPVHPRATCPP